MADPILLGQGHLTISVAAPADDARWIEEFFGDSYAATGNEPALVSVRLAAGERAPAGGVPIGDRLVFALDSGPIRLPAYRSSAHERLVEPDTGIAYEVSNDGGRVTVRYGDSPPQMRHGGQSPNRLTARVRLMRVVREYLPQRLTPCRRPRPARSRRRSRRPRDRDRRPQGGGQDDDAAAAAARGKRVVPVERPRARHWRPHGAGAGDPDRRVAS